MTYQLYLGDCLDFMRTLDAGSVDAVITDPPYGIAWSRGDNQRMRNSRAHNGILGDGDTSLRDSVLRKLQDKPCVVFGSFYAPFPENTKQVLVWHKPADSGLVGSVTGFRRDAEPIFLCGTWPVRLVMYSSVLHVARGQSSTTSETGHPHTKPRDLMYMLIEQCTCKGDTVFDPFMGSGTTGVACMQLGRNFIGCEIDLGYYAIAERRIRDAVAQPPLFHLDEPKIEATQAAML